MTSELDGPSGPATFYASPAEAHAARRRRSSSIWLACTRAPAWSKPDFLAVVDAEEGRVVHELPMPNVGDELHHFGWNRVQLGVPWAGPRRI